MLKLPERSLRATAAANAKLKEQVEGIITDFVAEVEVCADLNHPNLVRLLGYADKPRLMVVQELCQGNSLDHQLYVQGWRPSHAQILKVASDVAKGMEYLHTRYTTPDSTHAQPIIHRDLKSPNLLLVASPTEEAEVMVKVTDFGLSRDKGLDSQNFAQTVMMTGCGSVLWMAPEILLGDTYNEKVDVFSFAMCLAECVSGRLPWSGIAGGAEVPHKVTQGERPEMQLAGTADRPVDAQIEELIRDCWQQEAARRPSFSNGVCVCVCVCVCVSRTVPAPTCFLITDLSSWCSRPSSRRSSEAYRCFRKRSEQPCERSEQPCERSKRCGVLATESCGGG